MKNHQIRVKKIISFLLLFSLLEFFVPFQTISSDEDLSTLCESIEKVEAECNRLSKSDCRSLLEKCEDYFNQKSAEIEKDLSKTRAQKITLQNKVYSLKKEIEQLNIQINQGNLVVHDLKIQINDTQNSIEQTSKRIEEVKGQIEEILRDIYEKDQKTNLEILLSENKISDFFNDILELEVLSERNKELLKDIKQLKSYLSQQKESLSEEKERLERQLVVQTLQKQQSEQDKKEKEELLRKTQGSEKKYQAYLRETQEKAAKIRERIFELIGVSKAPTFGEAVEIAKYVEKITGIRPAFLLAILTQESNIGRNVGQCYLTNPQTGAGKRVSSGAYVKNVMNPTRDVPYFLSITKKLGRDPYNTLVSCPLKYGWGGAMGPAQFIPSTWAKVSLEAKPILGRDPDPWDIKDSFLVAGLYLRDLGGTKNEWRAAMRYFSGSSWSKYEEFYGNSVMRLAKKYQQDIETIEK